MAVGEGEGPWLRVLCTRMSVRETALEGEAKEPLKKRLWGRKASDHISLPSAASMPITEGWKGLGLRRSRAQEARRGESGTRNRCVRTFCWAVAHLITIN